MLAVLRFPEKFAILAVLALAFAGVLGWQRLLDERDAGRAERGRLAAGAGGRGAGHRPGLRVPAAVGAPGRRLAHRPSTALPTWEPRGTAAAVAYLRAESWAAVATAAAVTALLALCRWRRPSRRLLEGLAVALLAVDLWHYGHGLVAHPAGRRLPVPPPLAAAILPADDRIFVQQPPAGDRRVVPRAWGETRGRCSPAPTSPGWSPTRGCSGTSPTPSTATST